MTIIGQNKKYMTNYDNANGISITEFGKYDRSRYEAEIVIRFNKENVTLGKFKTVAKAEKVFQEIIESIESNKLYIIPGEWS